MTTDRTKVRSALLADADTIINGDRNVSYGPPSADFARTAAMWTAYLGTNIEQHDVAAMMALLKVSRIRWSPTKRDHWQDLAGYAACGWDCVDGYDEAPADFISDPLRRAEQAGAA